MSKGDVILVPFPFTDLSGQKVRPALILHDNSEGEDCIVVFISSIKQKKIFTFDVKVTLSKQNGLKVDSVIKVNKIATLQKNIVLGKLGTVESGFMADVGKKLRQLFQI